MMLAWESPRSIAEQCHSEGLAKEKEDREDRIDNDIPLFYSDLLPLLVDDEGNVGEEAFVWIVSLFPLAADVVNVRFTFEALTAPTAGRLHFPAYDRFLKEMDKCIKYLQKQQIPTGVELAEDEFILHVEGTAKTQRVVRHIGTTSWPGRLTLTNKALYFEASGALSYENALKIDLSRTEAGHRLSATSTGPWGVPLFDKAITYESEQQADNFRISRDDKFDKTRSLARISKGNSFATSLHLKIQCGISIEIMGTACKDNLRNIETSCSKRNASDITSDSDEIS
ncbi:uncharacterized protein LOC120278003 isoform X3 [Dioscorea cayenensis subsp. rotundata]|uniref:Uncharacterized protein LOC120278003 isoform X3 n=1 Tax=Dioscorea cayennensis subsp. rotundata TaxID=55577 RepID=A0AB40CPV1_DIOCR|nr:uncharacterized protein LOC120278003 isoform X3 [Dioscorea cayenensis subsp. rotundata]